jgi:hypothetical protein
MACSARRESGRLYRPALSAASGWQSGALHPHPRATAQRTGVEHLILMVETTGEPARTLETISRLGAEVLPRLRRQPAAVDTNGTPRPTSS